MVGVLEIEHPFLFQAAEGAADGLDGQPQVVADVGPGHGQVHVVLAAAERMLAPAQVQQERRQPLHRMRLEEATRALRETDAPVICLLDADDECFSERLATQLRFLAENPDIDIVGSTIIYLSLNDMRIMFLSLLSILK